MRRLAVSAFIAVCATAPAQQVLVDYDNVRGAASAPTVGQSFWHSAVNTTSSGQNRNVGRWDDQTQVTSGSATNISRITATPPDGTLNAYELRWSFIGVATGTNRSANESDTFLRAFSSGTALQNPVISTSDYLEFDIWTLQPLRVCLIVSEAAQTANIGATGSGATPFEAIGGTGADALTTSSGGFGGFVILPGAWRTVTIDFRSISVRSFASGNGVLNPVTPNRVAINSLGFTPIDGEGGLLLQHQVYLDNWRSSPVPEPGTLIVLGLGAIGAISRRTGKRNRAAEQAA